MSRTKEILLAGSAAAAVVLAMVAWMQRAEIRRLRAIAETEPAGMPAVRPATKQSFMVAPAATRESGMAVLPAAGEALPPERATTARALRSGGLTGLMQNLEFVHALALQRRAMLDQRFGELFRRLNLPDDELARFKHLLAEKENVALEVITVAESSGGVPLSADALRAGVRLARQQVEDAIRSSLGDERYSTYLEYERTLPQRATIAQLEQRLSYTPTPLTPAQSESLVQILAAHAPATPVEAAPPLSVVVQTGGTEVVPVLPASAATGRVTEQVVAQAEAILSPPQVEALREIQLEQQAALRTAELVREALPPTEQLPGAAVLMLH